MRNKYRIALTEAGLSSGALMARGIPIPTVAPYKDHSVIVEKGDGSNREYGYKTVELMWDRLTAAQGRILYALVESARGGSGLLYLTIDRADGNAPGQDWIDVYGRPGRLVLTGEAPLNRHGYSTHRNVSLNVNNLTVVNDPSSYS